MASSLKYAVDQFVSLFYPKLCLSCGKNLSQKEDIICLPCQHYLRPTDLHQYRHNQFTDRFWGRFPLNAGAAMYYFTKKGRVQNLIHNLKYKGRPEVGICLGQRYGKALRKADAFRSVDLIIPVPLHDRKLKERGFNQSAAFAKGLSETWETPWSDQVLQRVEYTSTQTKKSRLERLQNVQEAFQLKDQNAARGKHILIVDDVMTTGATLEACAQRVLEVPGTSVSLVTIAFAMQP